VKVGGGRGEAVGDGVGVVALVLVGRGVGDAGGRVLSAITPPVGPGTEVGTSERVGDRVGPAGVGVDTRAACEEVGAGAGGGVGAAEAARGSRTSAATPTANRRVVRMLQPITAGRPTGAGVQSNRATKRSGPVP
jgi:hypothetical protein